MLETEIVSANFVDQNSLPGSQPSPAELIIFNGAFSTSEARYQFEIRSDGTGSIVYPDSFSDSEDFFHEVNFESIIREIERSVAVVCELEPGLGLPETSEVEHIRQEITADELEEVFWEEINPNLEDPFYRVFDDVGEWGEAFYCERGETAELEEFLALCVLTEKEISNPDDYLIVNSATECEEAGLSDSSYSSERLVKLVRIACDYFQPSGCAYDYNDGWGDRYSGYSMNSEAINVSLKESVAAPAREKILAMVKLRERLNEMTVAPETIADLTGF